MFHAEIINDTKKLNAEMAKFVPIPVVSQITPQEVSDNFFQIKYDIKQLIEREVAMLIELKNRAEQVQWQTQSFSLSKPSVGKGFARKKLENENHVNCWVLANKRIRKCFWIVLDFFCD